MRHASLVLLSLDRNNNIISFKRLLSSLSLINGRQLKPPPNLTCANIYAELGLFNVKGEVVYSC
jgi:hypothetical protein